MAGRKQSASEKAKENAPVVTSNDRAMLALRPTVNAAAVIESFGKGAFGELDLNELITNLTESVKANANNDMSRCEAMLFSQANALQSIFTSMARRANAQGYLNQFQSYMAVALKAQNQCRMTLETLALIKNPPVFAKQANIAHGPQQVNNGIPPPAPSRAENSQSAQNKLLEFTDGERLDTATAGTAKSINKAMATVEMLDRPANR